MKRQMTHQERTIPENLQDILADVPDSADTLAEMQVIATDFDADPEFVADYMKSQFVEDVLEAMAAQGLNRNTLAKKLGKSRQYVGKVLNETSNFTFETVAEFACALGMHASVRMCYPPEAPKHFETNRLSHRYQCLHRSL